MSICDKKIVFVSVLAAIGASAALPRAADACSCKAHFEIVNPEDATQTGIFRTETNYFGFKPDVPRRHFEAHQRRGRGETDNQCRRRAREAAYQCMSDLWRDRIRLQAGDPHAAPKCRLGLGESTVIRPDPAAISSMDLKTELEKAACCGNSPWRYRIDVTRRVFMRTYGERGCGPNLQTVELRHLTDYNFDCKAIRAREGYRDCGAIELTVETNYNRPGGDMDHMPLKHNKKEAGSNARHCRQGSRKKNCDVTTAKKCRSKCIDDPACRAWTWVKPGVNGPEAQCWLKEELPWAKGNDCCSSGVVR